MIAAAVWHRIRAGISKSPAAQDENLQRVGIRLAAQTVGLLLVMLIVLEVALYLITQRALLQSLESTLRGRCHPPPEVVHRMYDHPLYTDSGMLRPRPFHQPPSDASTAFLDRDLNPVGGGGGALGMTVVDLPAARQSLLTEQEECCSIRSYQGQSYLVYSDVLREDGYPVGVAQASISAAQYLSSLATLRRTLLLVALLGLLSASAISAVLVQRALHPIRIAVQRQRDFVADAAHELRTPLAIMRTVGELGLTNDVAEEDQQATIEQMLAENRHLTRLVDDLSLLARADSHAVAIVQAPVDLSSLVAETAAELTPLAEEQDVELGADVQGNVQVLGDVLRLRQLLLILLDNALKHTPAGETVRIRLQLHSGRARLQVVDSGPGIDPADLPRIFDRFYRADRARTGEGSGLGLAIARWIVEAHGGSIRADNAATHGAVFTVSLPVARPTPRS